MSQNFEKNYRIRRSGYVCRTHGWTMLLALTTSGDVFTLLVDDKCNVIVFRTKNAALKFASLYSIKHTVPKLYLMAAKQHVFGATLINYLYDGKTFVL